jgi:hypothetical protein
MFKKSILSYGLFLSILFVYGQDIQSPAKYLGYEIGERFTYHHQITGYFKHVAETSDRVMYVKYGETNEKRPLIAVVISSPENLSKIDHLRKNNLIAAGLIEGKMEGQQLPVVWLSYNIHGNEASGSEAAILALHYLATQEKEEVKKWLEELIIVIDPCLNPDGREKYAVWYHQASGKNTILQRESWEHQEPWPGSRVNHYLFDLNRDWAWQTQTETQQRLAFYQNWMPHVHIDFHEMGYESHYFFGPGAKPYNEAITEWQSEFQKLIGENLSQVFDQRSELYFTDEVFDLFSPAFGDTWPTFMGALGFTYEQGGGSAAGKAIIRSTGDTITLSKRLDNHYAATLGTLATAYEYREKIPLEFNKYYREGTSRFSSDYKTYLVKANTNPQVFADFFSLLERNQIQYYYPVQSSRKVSGYDYFTRKNITHQLSQNDIIIPSSQPNSHLVKVLFEPETKFHDTISYDLTAWSLPYIFNLPALALKESIAVNKNSKPSLPEIINEVPVSLPLAYLVEWKDFHSVKFLAALLKKQITLRYANTNFEVRGRKFEKGTLLINRPENIHFRENLDSVIIFYANQNNIKLYTAETGKSSKGKDFGSSSFHYIKPPKVAIVKGRGIGANSVGELWFYFDQEIDYPVALIDLEQIATIDLSGYDLIFLPSGSYSKPAADKILGWVRSGGRAIVMERALQTFEKDSSLIFGKTVKEYRDKVQKAKDSAKSSPDSLLIRFEDRRKLAVQNISASSIFRMSLDNSHPMSFGTGSNLFVIKRNSSAYPYLPASAFNIGYFRPDSHISGYVGEKLKKEMEHSLGIGQEAVGRGSLIYVTDTPIYRSFVQGGKLLLGNMIFFETSLNLRQNYNQ